MNNRHTIEDFIRENRLKFEADGPPEDHLDRFLLKLNLRLKHFIDIVPYIVKVSIATVLIFAASIIIWDNYIRKDRHEISLGNKISLVINVLRKQ
jgi:hypothetical protein